MLPDINAAVIGFALIRCVRGYRVVLAFVVKAHAAADTVVGCILGHIVNAALRQIFVVLLRSIGIRVAHEFERGIRMCLGNGHEVRELVSIGSQRRILIRSEVDAVEIIVVVDMCRCRRLNNRCDFNSIARLSWNKTYFMLFSCKFYLSIRLVVQLVLFLSHYEKSY